MLLRDILKYATTGKEAKMIVKQGKVKVDGKTRFDERFPVGLMDVVFSMARTSEGCSTTQRTADSLLGLAQIAQAVEEAGSGSAREFLLGGRQLADPDD
jgi:hypothetical protein